MSVSDEPALLRAILADPGDDTVRLAYADWLEEHDQPARAEFIRVQVGLARLPDYWTAETADEVHRLRRRERELWDDRRNVEWFPLPNGVVLELGHPPAQATSTAFVSRGFVSEITCTAAVFLGGPCRACHGNGEYVYGLEEQQDWCRICDGTGRTEGIAAEVFAAHPVTSVTLSDIRPWEYTGTGEVTEWGWWELNPDFPTTDPEDVGDVPYELFELMWHDNRANRNSDRQRRWLLWDEPGIAEQELSRACVVYGKHKAKEKK